MSRSRGGQGLGEVAGADADGGGHEALAAGRDGVRATDGTFGCAGAASSSGLGAVEPCDHRGAPVSSCCIVRSPLAVGAIRRSFTGRQRCSGAGSSERDLPSTPPSTSGARSSASCCPETARSPSPPSLREPRAPKGLVPQWCAQRTRWWESVHSRHNPVLHPLPILLPQRAILLLAPLVVVDLPRHQQRQVIERVEPRPDCSRVSQ